MKRALSLSSQIYLFMVNDLLFIFRRNVFYLISSLIEAYYSFNFSPIVLLSCTTLGGTIHIVFHVNGTYWNKSRMQS